MTNPIITYRNPVEMWFWEGGWIYVGVGVLVVFAVAWSLLAWEERKAKQRRKERYMKMNAAQRASWRYLNQRNNIEAKEWEK